jgi:hypothetical protein
MITTWADVRPGTLLTVKKTYNRTSYRIRVVTVEEGARGGYAFVTGQRLRMDGTPSRLKAHEGLGPGMRWELIHVDEVTGQAWDVGPLHEAAAAENASRRPRRLDANGKARRGTSNKNDRGGSDARRRRKAWLLTEFGNGTVALCSFACGTLLTLETITVDRFPLPGCQGGTYARGNIRPACSGCNSRHGAKLRSAA